MDRNLEKEWRERAVELGKSGTPDALPELIELTGCSAASVRRLAASAIGKLAGIANAAAAKLVLPDLRDMAINPVEPQYNNNCAKRTIDLIEEASCIAEKQAAHCCQRCGVKLEHDEYVRSQKAFQRTFCNYCFDEVFLDRRNFETKVELQKNIRAKDGTWVQSDGERLICEVLDSEKISYRYDERFRILDGYAIRPDFYLPEFDVYIEYWGMDTADYKIGMLKKQTLYQQQGKKLISLYPKDKAELREIILGKLRKLK